MQIDGTVKVFPSVDGLSPFYVDMTPAAVAGPFSTAVDVDRTDQLHYPSGIHGGLSTGVFETTSVFVIESRDRFSNRVLLGPRNEVLLIGITGATGGTFTLLVNGVSTTALNYNAAASTIAAAVQATGQVGGWLVWVGASLTLPPRPSVACSQPPDTHCCPPRRCPGPIACLCWQVGSLLATSPSVGVTRLELTSDLGDVPQLLEVGNTGLLTGSAPAVTLAQCDYGRRQLISVFSEAAPAVALGGTFRIVFNGAATVDIAFNAAPSVVKAALEDLDSITQVNVATSTTTNGGFAWVCVRAVLRSARWLTHSCEEVAAASTHTPSCLPIPPPRLCHVFGCVSGNGWVVEMASVDTGASGDLWLFPEGDLLVGGWLQSKG